MKALLRHHNLQDKLYCESAGTSSHHVGDSADERMRTHAKKRGLELDSLARQFTYEDFEKFDYIVTMDQVNYKTVMRLDPHSKFKEKVIPMAHLCSENTVTGVPDPYYGGAGGFEEVLDIVQDGCRGLLERLNLLKP